MKKYIKVIILIGLVLILVSCSSLKPDNLKIDFKRDKSSYLGYAAAVYEDRIYYVSNELGTSGIYSMTSDGSDVRLEAASPDITSIEVKEGILYFSGLFRINKSGGIWRDQFYTDNEHTLYSCAFSGYTKTVDYINSNYNVPKFYISQNGYAAISYGSEGTQELRLFDKERNESFSDTSDKIVTISFQYIEKSVFDTKSGNLEDKTENILKNIYQFGDLLIIARHVPEDNDYNRIPGDPYILDSNTGELVLAFDRKQTDALKAFCMDEENIYCSYKEMMVILDKATYQVKTTFIPDGLSNEYNITYLTKYGDKIYIIADYWRGQDNESLPLLGEKLYIMDPNTFECTQLLDLGSNQRTIGMYENYIILLDNGTIYKVDLNGGIIGERTKLLDAPSDIYSQPYTIDYAGDWMFIYKTYPEYGSKSDLPGQQLLYKINLQNGEVIQNDIKFDFSVLDSYIEK